MRSSKLLSALLLVGTLTLAAPGMASAHAEGRANCRYATQQNTVFNVAALGLGRVQQTFAGVMTGMTGIVTTIGELERAAAGVGRHVAAAVTGVARAAGESVRQAQTTIGLGPLVDARLHTSR